MCKFIGSGAFTIGGQYARVHDVNFSNTPGLVMDDSIQSARGIVGPVTVNTDSILCSIYDSQLTTVDWDANDGQIADSTIYSSLDVDADVFRLSNCLLFQLTGCSITGDDAVTTGNIFYHPGTGETADTIDGLAINGNRIVVESNKFIPAAAETRSAVNVQGGECNMIVGNDFGDCDDYATDCLVDAGANTQLFYPADATYGDNFTDCGTGS